MTRRILLVEDTEDNREIVRDLMDSVGYELLEANDGAAGLAMANGTQARFDPDGYPAAGHGWIRGHAPDQGGSGIVAHPNHCSDVLRPLRRRGEDPGGGLR